MTSSASSCTRVTSRSGRAERTLLSTTTCFFFSSPLGLPSLILNAPEWMMMISLLCGFFVASPSIPHSWPPADLAAGRPDCRPAGRPAYVCWNRPFGRDEEQKRKFSGHKKRHRGLHRIAKKSFRQMNATRCGRNRVKNYFFVHCYQMEGGPRLSTTSVYANAADPLAKRVRAHPRVRQRSLQRGQYRRIHTDSWKMRRVHSVHWCA